MNTENEDNAVVVEEEVQEEPKVKLKKDGTPAKKRGPKPGTKRAKKKTTKKKTAKKKTTKKRGRPRKDETSGPGRKPGKMKRDKKGRILKKDGTLAAKLGRKPKSAKKKTRATRTTTRSDARLVSPDAVLKQIKEFNKTRSTLRKQAQATLGTSLTQLQNNGTSKREANRLVKNINQLTEAIASL